MLVDEHRSVECKASALSVVGSLPTKVFRMKMETFKSHINLPLWLLEESPGGLACQFGRVLESFRVSSQRGTDLHW